MSRLDIMANIMAEKEREAELLPLDDEGIALAEGKRSTFDMPINVAKVDPLR